MKSKRARTPSSAAEVLAVGTRPNLPEAGGYLEG